MHSAFLVTIAVLLTVSSFSAVKCEDKYNSSQSDYINSNLNNPDVIFDDGSISLNDTEPLPEDDTGDSVYIIGKNDWVSAEQERKMLFYSPNKTLGHDCCPSTYELTSPAYARNLRGDMVTLYNSDTLRQQFVEVSCKEGTVNTQCRYMSPQYFNQSRCVQKYSFSYALIAINNDTMKSDNSSGEYSEHARPIIRANIQSESELYTLDHIVIRSGCSCVIDPKMQNDNTAKPGSDLGVRRVRKVRKITKMKKRSTKAPES